MDTFLERWRTPAEQAAVLYRILIPQVAQRIRALDAAIDRRRDALAEFERAYQARLGPLQRHLERALRLLHHLQRWERALAQHLRFAAPDQLGAFARQQLLQRQQDRRAGLPPRPQAEGPGMAPSRPAVRLPSLEQAPLPDPLVSPALPPPQAPLLLRLRRQLARQLHPDRADSPAEAQRRHALMAQVNLWVQQGDLERLQLLACAHLEPASAPLAPAGLQPLDEQWSWLRHTEATLQAEAAALEASDLARLSAYAATHGSVVGKVQRGLRRRLKTAYREVDACLHRLEDGMQRYNHERALCRTASVNLAHASAATNPLLALGLRQAQQLPASTEAKLQIWLTKLAMARPQLCRVVLLTYVCEQSALPLWGLETYAELDRRCRPEADVGANDDGKTKAGLATALVQLDRTVEYAVRQINPRLVRGGLRFVRRGMAAAIGKFIDGPEVGAQFAQLLRILGPRLLCTACAKEVHGLPSFALEGLDTLRALLCPCCGSPLQRYRLPRGDDITALFNAAYLRHGLLAEQRFLFGDAQIRLQFLPDKAQRPTLRQLLRQLHRDLFVAHGLQVNLRQLRTSPAEDNALRLYLVPEVKKPLTVDAAVKKIRAKIQTRWQAGP
jgi:hypothetical protein